MEQRALLKRMDLLLERRKEIRLQIFSKTFQNLSQYYHQTQLQKLITDQKRNSAAFDH
ncbi:hypothetical protein BDZ91DRAFT_756441 [Kalaharituber pfeilii]|nr:hypothetical protein BDZ91DRAFT_756441 [Kalaharituber pfeilii]